MVREIVAIIPKIIPLESFCARNYFEGGVGNARISSRASHLDGPNRQSLVFSERGQLSQAILHFHAERMLHE